MNSICLFSSYFNQPDIPEYVRYYLKELSLHFTKLVFVTNEKQLSDSSIAFLNSLNADLLLVKNEGHDFGMWYKAMLRYNVREYDRLGLVNDSCILFKPLTDFFQWLNQTTFDYSGLIDSPMRAYHIQSYFVVINKKAIDSVYDYFNQTGLMTKREDVIEAYEIGLSQYILSKGFKVGAFYIYRKFIRLDNPSVFAIESLIKAGFPMIKMKIIFGSFSNDEFIDLLNHWFNHDPEHYFKLIRQANKDSEIMDFNILRKDGYKRNLVKIWMAHLATPILWTGIQFYILAKRGFKKSRNILNVGGAA